MPGTRKLGKTSDQRRAMLRAWVRAQTMRMATKRPVVSHRMARPLGSQVLTHSHTPAAAKVLAGDKVPPYGARELRRTVSRAVEQALADRIAAGTAHPGTVYTADVDADGHIILTEDTLAACV